MRILHRIGNRELFPLKKTHRSRIINNFNQLMVLERAFCIRGGWNIPFKYSDQCSSVPEWMALMSRFFVLNH